MTQLITFFLFIYSIIIHEISHGLVAERLGDPTARLNGRLTLKPRAHIDPFMSIFFPLTLLLSGSPIIFGSAKPVPIDPYNLRDPKKDMGKIALAGPLSNFLLAVFFSLLARLFIFLLPSFAIIFDILKTVVQMNLVLMIFNLTPVPPFDGGRIAVALLPSKYARSLASLESIGVPLVIFLYLFPNRFIPLPQLTRQAVYILFRLIFPDLPLV